MKKVFLLLLLIIITLTTAKSSVGATSISGVSFNLLSIGPGYSFASPSSGSGGGRGMIQIGDSVYHWTEFLFTFVCFAFISATSVMSTYGAHRYFLQKGLKCIDIRPYLKVSLISSLLYIIVLLAAILTPFSPWIVLYFGLVTQLISFVVYLWRNFDEGSIIKNKDIVKAYTVSMASCSLILMFFIG